MQQPTHTLHHPYRTWFVCSCHAWAVLSSNPEDAHQLHLEHITRDDSNPLPLDVQRKALTYVTGKAQQQQQQQRQQRQRASNG